MHRTGNGLRRWGDTAGRWGAPSAGPKRVQVLVVARLPPFPFNSGSSREVLGLFSLPALALSRVCLPAGMLVAVCHALENTTSALSGEFEGPAAL